MARPCTPVSLRWPQVQARRRLSAVDDKDFSDERFEATTAELRRVIAERMFRDTEEVPRAIPSPTAQERDAVRAPWMARVAHRERIERIIGVVVVLLFLAFVIVGLIATTDT